MKAKERHHIELFLKNLINTHPHEITRIKKSKFKFYKIVHFGMGKGEIIFKMKHVKEVLKDIL